MTQEKQSFGLAAEMLKKALLDPGGVFTSPEDVIRNSDLSDAQKIDVLLRWAYNASSEAVALEEGMPGDDSDVLRRVLLALGKVTGPLDVEHTGPTKQHGLSYAQVSKSMKK